MPSEILTTVSLNIRLTRRSGLPIQIPPLSLQTTTSMSSLLESGIHNVNPYEGYPHLTELESEVLWQYAKLAQNIKEVSKYTSVSNGLRAIQTRF